MKPGDQPEESVTSSEFERFLAERAAAADALPTISATNNTNTNNTNTNTNRPTKDGDSGLFAL